VNLDENGPASVPGSASTKIMRASAARAADETHLTAHSCSENSHAARFPLSKQR
jgi:hypothetical protein